MSQAYTEAWLVGPQETKFYTRTYAPSAAVPTKAALVFVHGFAEHIGRYTHFHPFLSARGIAVFTYDQRGFGLTAQDTKGNKSKNSSYGKTSWKEQMGDIDWALQHAKKNFEGVPLFLMGHSMGGGEVLGFGTQASKGVHAASLKSLNAIIATSPLIQQATPAPKIAKIVGGKLSILLPSMLIPATVKAEQLSHDPEVGAQYLKDPLVKQSGSLKGINDMLSQGDLLVSAGYAHWPQELPLLIVHGTEDKVTSHNASQMFHDKISAAKKKITLFPGGYHELQNEPDGVSGKLAEEIITFVEEHLAATATSSDTAAETTQPTEESAESTDANATKAKM